MKYYIAYGSNLNMDQMAFRCPDAVPVGTTVLNGWELTFNSVLTIIPKKAAKTPVGVWKISSRDEHYLDAYEGFPRLYRKEEMKITVPGKDGRKRTVNAIVYIMNSGRKEVCPPTQYYYKTVHDGYRDFGFDTKTLNDAVKRSREEIIARYA